MSIERLRRDGLEHEDLFVRSMMLAVLANEPDPGLEAARAAARQIDRHGWRGAFEFSHQIADLPHSEETVEWAAQRLERLAPEDDEEVASEQFHLAQWFCKAPREMLLPRIDRFVDTIMAALPPETGDVRSNPVRFKNPEISFSRAAERLSTACYSTDKCLAEFEDVLGRCGKADEFPGRDIVLLEVLCESLAERGVLAEDRVRQWLDLEDLNPERELGPEDYRAGAALLIHGHWKTPPPLDGALKLFDLDWDWLNELVADSLAATGDAALLSRLLRRYPGLEWAGRLYLTGVFERLRSPECESALAEVLRNESDDHLRVELAYALALYGTPIGLKLAREVALEIPDDPERGEIQDYLCVHAILTGEENDETRRRHRLMAKRHADAQSAGARFASLLSGAGLSRGSSGTLPSDSRGKKDSNVIPFRPATPKLHPGVGRNDPCPCGSGKKFKKCCGP